MQGFAQQGLYKGKCDQQEIYGGEHYHRATILKEKICAKGDYLQGMHAQKMRYPQIAVLFAPVHKGIAFFAIWSAYGVS